MDGYTPPVGPVCNKTDDIINDPTIIQILKEETEEIKTVEEDKLDEIVTCEEKSLEEDENTKLESPSKENTLIISDSIEEIVPLDMFDTYMKQVRLQKTKSKNIEPKTEKDNNEIQIMNSPSEITSNSQEKSNIINDIDISKNRSCGNEHSNEIKDSDISDLNAEKIEIDDNLEFENNLSDSDDSDSFKLDLSDYDSDNNILDETLNEWQNQCVQTKKKSSPGKGKKSKSKSISGSKGEGISRIWKDKKKDDDLASTLEQLLDSVSKNDD